MRRIVRVDQHWRDADGIAWRVANVHRKDWMVRLEVKGRSYRLTQFVSFNDLGRDYELQPSEGMGGSDDGVRAAAKGTQR